MNWLPRAPAHAALRLHLSFVLHLSSVLHLSPVLHLSSALHLSSVLRQRLLYEDLWWWLLGLQRQRGSEM